MAPPVEGRLDRVQGDCAPGLQAGEIRCGRTLVAVEMPTENRQTERVERSIPLPGVLLKGDEALVAEGVPERVAREMPYRLEDAPVAPAEGEREAGSSGPRLGEVLEVDVLVRLCHRSRPRK